MIADPMRAAYLTHYAELYGANRGLLDLMTALRDAHGVRPHVLLAAPGPFTAVLESRSIPYAVVPWKPWVAGQVYMGGLHHRFMQWLGHRQRRRERERINASALPALVQQCRQWQVDLVHVNSSVIGLGPALSNALQKPWVWHVRELIGLHYGFVPDGGARALATKLRTADAVIAVSDAVRRELQAQAGGRLPVHMVHNSVRAEAGINERNAQADRRWAHTMPFHFVLVGVFHASKGQLEAVDAIAQLRAEGLDVKLTLVGGGDDTAVRDRIARRGVVPHVELTGYVDDPTAIYQQAHCMLMCSRHEAFGRVTVEAMSSGLPVIGHRSGGTPELIDHGRNGFLYEADADLVDHMRSLVTDPERARRMGEEALRSPAVARTIAHMAADVARIYSAMIERTR